MEWDHSLDTGEEKIDEQHREIVELCKDLSAAEKDGPNEVRSLLDHLTEYVAVHFALEQDLMRRVDYPADAMALHLAEHEKMTAITREKVLEYRTGELTSVTPILEYLEDWIGGHIMEVDAKLAEHVRRVSAEQA